MYIHIHTFIFHVKLCIYICTRIHIYTVLYIYSYVYVCVCAYVCIYIHVYTQFYMEKDKAPTENWNSSGSNVSC